MPRATQDALGHSRPNDHVFCIPGTARRRWAQHVGQAPSEGLERGGQGATPRQPEPGMPVMPIAGGKTSLRRQRCAPPGQEHSLPCITTLTHFAWFLAQFQPVNFQHSWFLEQPWDDSSKRSRSDKPDFSSSASAEFYSLSSNCLI